MSQKTVKGYIWFFFNSFILKLLTFVAQIILGWKLSPDEFGLFAIAVSIGTVMGMIRNGGVERLLIKKGYESKSILAVGTKYALLFNLLGCLLLVLLSPVVSVIYGSDDLLYMILIIAFSIPFATPGVFYRSSLAIDSRFKELSMVYAGSGAARQLSLIIFALMGFGVFSFVIPIFIEVIAVTIIGKLFVKEGVQLKKINSQTFKELFKDAKWLMLGTLVLGFATTGDLFLLGLMLSTPDLGVYFFGLQFVVAIAALFSSGIEGVMQSTFLKFGNNVDRLLDAFVRVCQMLFFIALPIAILIAMSVDTIIHLLWGGKWDNSSTIAFVFFLSMPFWLLVYVCRSSLEAMGLWQTRLRYLSVYGLGSMAAGFAASFTKDIVLVAVAVAMTRMLIGIMQYASIIRLLKGSFLKHFKSILISILGSILAAVLLLLIRNYIDFDMVSIYGLLFECAIFTVAILLYYWIFMKEQLMGFLEIIYKR